MADENATERVSDATRAADRVGAQAHGQPDRMPTPEEEAAADKLQLDPEVESHYKEMAERGAQQRGEGRID